MAVNPKVRFSFKIDLDQVFDQSALRAHTGKTALQLLCNPHWGGQATDYLGRNVDLGMLAGGLVNESDSHQGLFVPDVVRPNTSVIARQFSSKRVFCPQWPQAVSTEAEIMQRGADYQRIHVTGGTTGICDTALRAWQPFTPSFINRAEDQAFGLSALGKDSYLAHLHAPGLIMRHDKQAFAARAIAHADAGKAIGDIERIMLFSRYAELHVQGFDAVQNHLWPFTACFLHPTAQRWRRWSSHWMVPPRVGAMLTRAPVGSPDALISARKTWPINSSPNKLDGGPYMTPCGRAKSVPSALRTWWPMR